MINTTLALLLIGLTTPISTDKIAAEISTPNHRQLLAIDNRNHRHTEPSIGGVRAGMTEPEVRTKLPNPLRRKQGRMPCIESYTKIDYPNTEIYLAKIERSFLVHSLSTSNPKLTTETGVKVGDRIEVAKRYYQLTKLDSPTPKLTDRYIFTSKSGARSLIFETNKSGKIVRMRLLGAPIC
jgi:hypothetical protein